MATLDARLHELGLKPLRDHYGPATATEVDEMERKLCRPLPVDYRNFLLNFGCARFDELVSAPLPEGDREAPVAVFFGGADSKEPVSKQVDQYAEQLQPGLLPIARDPFGNLFILELGDVGAGRIWYAEFADDGFGAVPIARSFDEFLRMLTVEPYDD